MKLKEKLNVLKNEKQETKVVVTKIRKAFFMQEILFLIFKINCFYLLFLDFLKRISQKI
jgi:hypothetical protein